MVAIIMLNLVVIVISIVSYFHHLKTKEMNSRVTKLEEDYKGEFALLNLNSIPGRVGNYSYVLNLNTWREKLCFYYLNPYNNEHMYYSIDSNKVKFKIDASYDNPKIQFNLDYKNISVDGGLIIGNESDIKTIINKML